MEEFKYFYKDQKITIKAESREMADKIAIRINKLITKKTKNE